MAHGESGAIAQTPKTDYLELVATASRLFPQELDTIFSSDQGAIQALESVQQKLVRASLGITTQM